MSRHPLTGPQADPKDEDAGDVYVNFIAAHAVPKAMRLDEIKSAALSDSTLQEVASRSAVADGMTLTPRALTPRPYLHSEM